MDLPSGGKTPDLCLQSFRLAVRYLDLMSRRRLDQKYTERFPARFLSAATRYLLSGDQSRCFPTASIRVGNTDATEPCTPPAAGAT